MNHPTIGFILSIFPFFLFCLCVILIFICFIIQVVLVNIFLFITLKDIEKKYKTKLNIHPSLYIFPAGRIRIAFHIVFMFLNEKKIFKNRWFVKKDNPLLEINYKALEEKKSNIYVCFALMIPLLLAFMLLGLIALIIKIDKMNHGL